jgi:hypothetical protein
MKDERGLRGLFLNNSFGGRPLIPSYTLFSYKCRSKRDSLDWSDGASSVGGEYLG